MIHADFKQYLLNFKKPSGTSRGVLKSKETWFLIIRDQEKIGIGECGMFRGLSIDDRPEFEDKLRWMCRNIDLGEAILYEELREFPALQIGLETAFRSFASDDPFQVFPSEFSRGEAYIPINGLIWMGSQSFMEKQIAEKIEQGFDCLKLKIGALDFQTELSLLKMIRRRFSADQVTIRVDANGAYKPDEALEKLKWLSDFQVHSIEQPIRQGQWQEMATLCEVSPIPIALDEELIGIFNSEDKEKMLRTIQPQYIILKPTLVGGFYGTDEWTAIAQDQNCGWWITSALESNVGLNAISQFTFIKNSKLPQGLGTGSLFTNNVKAPLFVDDGKLHYKPKMNWNMELFNS